jgi:hypothetical protein
MRHEFYEIYKDLFDLYRSERLLRAEWFPFLGRFLGFDFRWIRWITEAIEGAVSDLALARRIRPDGKHFLLVNLHQMVVLPVAYSERQEVEAIRQDLMEDIIAILSTANEAAGRGEEITARHILNATSRLWSSLRLNRLEIWG